MSRSFNLTVKCALKYYGEPISLIFFKSLKEREIYVDETRHRHEKLLKVPHPTPQQLSIHTWPCIHVLLSRNRRCLVPIAYFSLRKIMTNSWMKFFSRSLQYSCFGGPDQTEPPSTKWNSTCNKHGLQEWRTCSNKTQYKANQIINSHEVEMANAEIP